MINATERDALGLTQDQRLEAAQQALTEDLAAAGDTFLASIRDNYERNFRTFSEMDPETQVEIRGPGGWLVFSGTAAQCLAVAF